MDNKLLVPLSGGLILVKKRVEEISNKNPNVVTDEDRMFMSKLESEIDIMSEIRLKVIQFGMWKNVGAELP